jgi:ankyrin repeat protein
MQALVVNKGVIDTGAQVRLAARNNDKAELEALLRAGADPDAADPAGLTPLMDAVIGGAPDTLAALLDAKANFALKNLDGLTALAMAVMAENQSAAAALLAAGADPNLPVADTTLLALAALTGDAAMVELLLANKASPSLKDKEGNRPAAIAAAMGLTDIAKLLGGAPELVPVPDIFRAIDSGSAAEVKKAIDAGALKGNPRRDGWSPLAYAAATSTLPVTRLVYEADGAAWRQKGPDGTTVLAAALSHRNPSTARDIVGLLLDKVGYSGMADFLGQADNSSRSNLTLLALMAGPPPSDTIYAFRDGLSDALLHRSDNTGITPLIAAVLTKNIWFLQAVQAESLSMSASWNGTSLQDLARGRGDYLTLAFLPDDRPMPYGLKKGASKSVKMDLQQRLSDWGYYSGSIDGQFGPASRGAMIAFLKDREEELTAMSKAIGSAGVDRPDGFWTYDYGPDVDYDTLSFTVEKPSENCTWKFNRWRQRPGDNRTTTFMGCINANDDAWNADGVGYATYPSGSNELSLFGANGWNGEVDLR